MGAAPVRSPAVARDNARTAAALGLESIPLGPEFFAKYLWAQCEWDVQAMQAPIPKVDSGNVLGQECTILIQVSQFSTLTPHSSTLNPQPSTLDAGPWTLSPILRALHSTPLTLRALNLNPKL
jgi:hypothetical protein